MISEWLATTLLGPVPWNGFLVRIDVADDIWAAREVLRRPPPVGWDAIPEALVSRNVGSH